MAKCVNHSSWELEIYGLILFERPNCERAMGGQKLNSQLSLSRLNVG